MTYIVYETEGLTNGLLSWNEPRGQLYMALTGHNEAKMIAAAVEVMKIGGAYRYAHPGALVTAEGVDTLEALFSFAQSLEAPWYEKEGVRLLGNTKRMISMSVGTIVMDVAAVKWYIVAPVGFVEIPANE
jgi:hypothetical protein